MSPMTEAEALRRLDASSRDLEEATQFATQGMLWVVEKGVCLMDLVAIADQYLAAVRRWEDPQAIAWRAAYAVARNRLAAIDARFPHQAERSVRDE